MKIVRESVEFDWDKGNKEKNKKHRVDDNEAEEPFFDEQKVMYRDVLHSKSEERFILLGKTKRERLLYIIFTMRKGNVRIISARDMNKKEVQFYEKAI